VLQLIRRHPSLQCHFQMRINSFWVVSDIEMTQNVPKFQFNYLLISLK
jgi:hypothetical protein